MNSHRDNVKDAMATELGKLGIELDELPFTFADAVFDVLGITEDEQDMAGGYFRLHTESREVKEVAVEQS